MTSRFMTDPHAMRDMAGRFEVHAQTVEDEARRMWASAQNISGAGWSGMAEATSLDTMTQMNQAFRNIVNMLHGVRDGLVRDANNYEQQEQASQQILQRLQDAGKTKRAALRCLKRRLARTVFQALRTVHQPSSEHTQPAAACHRSYCSSHLGEPPRLTDMTQKTRIQPLPPKRAGLLIRALYRIAKRRFGEVPEPFTVTAHHRRLLIANVVHEALLQRASRKLPPSVRELAVFWTARSIGCSWCVDFGAMLQRLDGLDVDRLTDIDNYATSSKFSDDERAAIAYAEAMTADPHSVTDEQVADLRARFGEAGVIELTYQIGVENMRARMNSALGITEQGFNSGDACRVPWAAPDVPSAESR